MSVLHIFFMFLSYSIPAMDRRPGILVIVNGTDWELEGEGDYLLQKDDKILFISTLHGG